MNKVIFIQFPKILIFLIPFFLITGPFLSDLAVTIVSILFVIKIIREKNFQVFDNIFFKFFFLFYIYLVINSLINNYNLDSFRIAITYIRFGLFTLAFVYFLKQDNKLLIKIFWCLLICFLGIFFDATIQFLFGKNILGFELHYPGPRVSSFFGDELIMGSYVSRFYPILFGLFIVTYNFKKQYLLILLSLSSVFVVFLSGERTAIFLILLSLILKFILIYENKIFLKKIFFLTTILVLVVLSFSETLRNRIVNITIEEMTSVEELPKFEKDDSVEKSTNLLDNNIKIFSRQHEEHYISALRMFKDNIFLGVGIKNFRKFCNEKDYKISDYTCSPHPHSTYIQIISEIGLIGFLFIVGIFIKLNLEFFSHFIRSMKKKPKYNDFTITILVSIYLSFWPFIPSGNFFNNWLSIVYFYPAGIAIWAIKEKIKLIK